MPIDYDCMWRTQALRRVNPSLPVETNHHPCVWEREHTWRMGEESTTHDELALGSRHTDVGIG